MATLPNSSIPQQTALHRAQRSLLLPRIIHHPYPSNRIQRETHWAQRLNSLFAKQRY
ncbi:MAG: hypothetical protein WAQ53_02840 [Thiofilum sp.]|uniref:hypothetical protein n=1 Tax=Thiofilum sp. TaxID=2212733 RepID=UPI0025EA7FFF|nr:hypothetical protein [Thiofilum sp.]MBK8454625.1 hypothetical protein [Thiofilum sp.]